jgi:hypothetical protein
MHDVVHILGNGDKAIFWNNVKKSKEETKLICNLPPFDVPIKDIYASVMVDFKMMAALTEGSLNLDSYRWVLGNRPKIWMTAPGKSTFYFKYAPNIREFYLTVPKYAGNATNFNCGHMAVHYAAARLQAKEIHMYGFDSIFDFNMRSFTDTVLMSDRGNANNFRLLANWRPIWTGIFKEFPNTKFVMHHDHSDVKIEIAENVHVVIHDQRAEEPDHGDWDKRLVKSKKKSNNSSSALERLQSRV